MVCVSIWRLDCSLKRYLISSDRNTAIMTDITGWIFLPVWGGMGGKEKKIEQHRTSDMEEARERPGGQGRKASEKGS